MNKTQKEQNIETRKRAMKKGWLTGDEPTDRAITELRQRVEELEAIVNRIPNVASYVVATLDSAARSDEEWGEVHRGRAGSSIRQLESLGDQAMEAIDEEDA